MIDYQSLTISVYSVTSVVDFLINLSFGFILMKMPWGL